MSTSHPQRLPSPTKSKRPTSTRQSPSPSHQTTRRYNTRQSVARQRLAATEVTNPPRSTWVSESQEGELMVRVMQLTCSYSSRHCVFLAHPFVDARRTRPPNLSSATFSGQRAGNTSLWILCPAIHPVITAAPAPCLLLGSLQSVTIAPRRPVHAAWSGH